MPVSIAYTLHMTKQTILLISIILICNACNDSSGQSVSKCDNDSCNNSLEPSEPNIEPGPIDPQPPEPTPDDPQPPKPTPDEPQPPEPTPDEPQPPEPTPDDPQPPKPTPDDPQPPEPTPDDPQPPKPTPDDPAQKPDPQPAKPQPITPVVTDDSCTTENETRCHNDGWHGFIERCVSGFWQKEQTCGEYSCMNDKECGECLGGTRTCQNDIMTWCQNGKQYHKKCNRCLSSGNICEYFDHEEFCQELTPGYGIEYIGDVWYTPYVCEGPCNEDGTACAQGYHCQDGESYCFDDGFIIGNGASDIKQITCKNGQWEYERCILGCNANHTACVPVDNIDDYRCTNNEDGSLRSECYEDKGKSYERYCDDGFWSPPKVCDGKCTNNHQSCLSPFTGACSEEGRTICHNDSSKHQYGTKITCKDGEWVETQSCGLNSCDGDHCGVCTNYEGKCIDGSEFIYCHQGKEFHIDCACDSTGCQTCNTKEDTVYCRDINIGIGKLYTCESGNLKMEDCKFSNGVNKSCNAMGNDCN